MSTISRTTRYRNLTGKGNGTATFSYDSDRPLQVTGAEVAEPEIGYDAEWELSLLGGER